MAHIHGYYGYYKDAMEKWSTFPDWLNQEYYDRSVNTTEHDLELLRARVDITSDGTSWFYRAYSAANNGITTGQT